MWMRDEAIDLCRAIEEVAPAFGCHVALTGGLLYKFGPRKDCDVLFYRIRQVDEIDIDGLFDALKPLGIERVTDKASWCIKATHAGRHIDCFFPELPGDHESGPKTAGLGTPDVGPIDF
jgi:hypothetical protein